jgi:hypothetical protein
VAEGVGFEPTRELAPPGGFQDRCLKPLGHPSVQVFNVLSRFFIRQNITFKNSLCAAEQARDAESIGYTSDAGG